MVSDARSRAVDKVARLASESTDLVSFWRASTDVVTPVLPHWWAPCFFTLDPASTLVTSHFHEGLDEFPADALAAEYTETTFIRFLTSSAPSVASRPFTR